MKSKPRLAARVATSTLLTEMTGPMTDWPLLSLSLTLFVNRSRGWVALESLVRMCFHVEPEVNP
jgi:hypothetical protein